MRVCAGRRGRARLALREVAGPRPGPCPFAPSLPAVLFLTRPFKPTADHHKPLPSQVRSEWRLQAQRAARPSHSSSATFPSPRQRASCELTAHDLHLLVTHLRCTPKPLLGRGSWEQHAARTPARPAWARALARASAWGWTAGHGLPNGVGPAQLFAHMGPPPPGTPTSPASAGRPAPSQAPRAVGWPRGGCSGASPWD